MIDLQLPGTDVATTALGFGCGGLMRVPSRKARQRLLGEAFECGIRHFDVARSYGLGAAEGELGAFARGKRDQLVIATKFGIDISTGGGRFAAVQGVARRFVRMFPALRKLVRGRTTALYQPRCYDAQKARTSLETSLRELGTDYVDLLLLHEPTLDAVRESDVLEFLQQAKSSGKIRAFGVSGEAASILPICREMPALCGVVQIANDAINRTIELFDPSGPRPTVTFSVLTNALPMIVKYVGRDRETKRRWRESTGVDCTSAAEVARLLLRYSVRANPGGVTLYSTTRAERLSTAVDTIGEKRDDSTVLDKFLRLIDKEIRPPAASLAK